MTLSLLKEEIKRWESLWDESLAYWSSFIKLRKPVFCMNNKESKKQGLTSSFAMIRLNDHQVVIDMELVLKKGVSGFDKEILCHEIGHHVYVPANLYDFSKLISRIRWGLAGIEDRAPMIMNLYSDQLINNFLQGEKGLNMAGVYEKLKTDDKVSRLWIWYLRTYEHLWGLDKGKLTGLKDLDSELDSDASIGASLIRTYSRQWLDGAGRYAALAYPYLIEDEEFNKAKDDFAVFDDAGLSGAGGGSLSGLTEIDEEELREVIDPRTEVIKEILEGDEESDNGIGRSKGGKRINEKHRNPSLFAKIAKQIDPNLDDLEILRRYYRERAMPYLIPFPVERKSEVSMHQPEGTDIWEVGDPIEELDFFESAFVSNDLIPGVTTRKRVYGISEDMDNNPEPVNLYIGIDCSGSMMNPANNISWPVLAGTILGLSAIRSGAKVKATLSGEPGEIMDTDDFTTDEKLILTVLTSYLGTGYAFGLNHLEKTFKAKLKKKTHILIITDSDIFSMLREKRSDGKLYSEIAADCFEKAGGGGTFLLHMRENNYYNSQIKDLKKQGWEIFFVTDEKDMVKFAASFAKKKYGDNI